MDFDNQYQSFHSENVTDDEILQSLARHEDEKSKSVEPKPPLPSAEEEQPPFTSAPSPVVNESTEEATTVKKRSSITPSTSASEMATATAKKTKLTEDFERPADEDLPRFLSHTNHVFEETLKPLLVNSRVPGYHNNMDHLRKIALLKFYIALNELDISLWNAYLQSGMGQILEQVKEPTAAAAASTRRGKLSLWPSDLKEKIIQSGFVVADAQQGVTDTDYQNFIAKKIRRCREKTSEHQKEIREVKTKLTNLFTSEIDRTLDQFVEQYGTSFHRVPTKGMIAAIEYQYQDRLFELEFRQEDPRDRQLETFQKLSQLKYEKENTKMNVAVLKQRLFYNHLPSSFESLHIPEPISLHEIASSTVRQRLSEQYHKVLQRTKSDMLQVYIATEQAKADQCMAEFNEYHEKVKENQRIGLTGVKLTSTMWHLVQRRLTNVNKHIITLYNLKIDFFAKAPTGKN